VKGRLPAGIGGGRQVASKMELPSIHLPCLAYIKAKIWQCAHCLFYNIPCCCQKENVISRWRINKKVVTFGAESLFQKMRDDVYYNMICSCQ
jgi:hypothetical protein